MLKNLPVLWRLSAIDKAVKEEPIPVKTRFYCENCGREVPFNAEVCPYCGKVFDAVKCPICGYEGSPEEFTSGCPKCGYLSVSSGIKVDFAVNAENVDSEKSKTKGKKFNKGGRKKKILNLSPPFFKAIVGVLVLVLIFLIYLLFRV